MSITANWIKPGGPNGTGDPKNEEAPSSFADTSGTAMTGALPPWSPDNGTTLFWCGGEYGNLDGGNDNKFAAFDMWMSTDLPNHQNWAKIDSAHAPAPLSPIAPLNFMDARFILSPDGTKVIVAYVSIPNASPIVFQDFSLLTGTWGPQYGTNTPNASHVNNVLVRADGSYVVIYSPFPAGGSNVWAAISGPNDFTTWTLRDLGVNYAPFSGGASALNKNLVAALADGVTTKLSPVDNVHVVYQDSNQPPTYIYQLLKPDNTLGLFTVLNKLQTIRSTPSSFGNLVKFGCYLWMPVQGDVTDRNMWAMVMPVSNPGLWGKLFIFDPGTLPGIAAPPVMETFSFSTDGQSIVLTLSWPLGVTTGLLWMATSRDGLTWVVQEIYDPTDVNNSNPPHLDVVPPFRFRATLYKSGPGYSGVTTNAPSTLATASDSALWFPFVPVLPSLCLNSYGTVTGTNPGGGTVPSANGGALPPPPIMTPLLNERGTPSLPWVAWFNAVYQAEITGS